MMFPYVIVAFALVISIYLLIVYIQRKTERFENKSIFKYGWNMDPVDTTIQGYPKPATRIQCYNDCKSNPKCSGYFVKGDMCWNKSGKLELKETDFCSKNMPNDEKCTTYLKKRI